MLEKRVHHALQLEEFEVQIINVLRPVVEFESKLLPLWIESLVHHWSLASPVEVEIKVAVRILVDIFLLNKFLFPFLEMLGGWKAECRFIKRE